MKHQTITNNALLDLLPYCFQIGGFFDEIEVAWRVLFTDWLRKERRGLERA